MAEHVYHDEGARPSRYSVSWMVPEVDQVLMGQGLSRWLDPYMDGPRAARLRALTRTIHQKKSEDPALAGLGSMLGAAYEAGFFGGDPVSGHYLALALRGDTAPRRIPLLVFLHGSAGNFASYWQVLAPLARQGKAVVICPTFGFGNWARRRGGVDHVLASIRHARRRFPGVGRVYLVGLSNGGTGVTALINRCGRRGCLPLAGVAYISGVLSARSIGPSLRRSAWRGLPVLVVHGHRDLRIPHATIRGAVRALRRGGARISRLDYRQEDHFLFFAKREQVVARLGRWIAGR